MKKILAALVCLTFLGAPVLGDSCCKGKQQSQQQCAKQKMCKKSKCDSKGKCGKKRRHRARKCSSSSKCKRVTDTWMMPAPKCKKGC